MPNPRNNIKASGDVHLPEIESDLPMQEGSPNALGKEGTPSNRGRGTEMGKEGIAGRGINKAGFLKDKDDDTSNSYDTPRNESSEKGRAR